MSVARCSLVGALFLVACAGAEDDAKDDAELTLGGGTSETGSTSASGAATGPGGAKAAGSETPYNRAVQKSVHNSYERHEPLIDLLVYHRVRSIELDIHRTRDGSNAPRGDWFVFHDDSFFSKGETSCSLLSDCLGQLAAFHRALPKHEVVTVWLDLKTGFAAGQQPEDIDATLVKGIGRANIVGPEDLLEACPGAKDLRAAVSGACAFPSLDALRGKFIFATTGGSACSPSSTSNVARYGGDDPKARLAFVAPNLDGGCTSTAYDARKDIVFFNLAKGETARAAEVKRRGLVSRIWGLDSERDYEAARAAGANHLATDKANLERDTWANTFLPRGYPFSCEGCSADLVEPGPMLGLRAKGGDQWGSADSGFFAYERDEADATWSALVSVPSSHVEPWAKACIVARASEEPGAANVSVCRAFDENKPRIQVRSSRNGSTSASDARDVDGVNGETPAFLRLAVRAASGSSEVTASSSHNGKDWVAISKVTVNGKLPIRGVSTSAHGVDGGVKALFADLVRERGGQRTSVNAAALQKKAIGSGASGEVFDGVFPP